MNPTHMRREILEIPEVAQRQIDQALDDYLAVGKELARSGPPAFVTCARGTSDQAALWFKYLMEIIAGAPVASMGPSVASVYNAPLRAPGMVAVTISQSGGSPDLLKLQQALSLGGARTLALVNVTASPVGEDADLTLPLLAGEERAVAATKSFTASLLALAAVTAGFADTPDAPKLTEALRALPECLRQALETPWPETATETLANAKSLYTLSRGPSAAIAGEAALKLKETCRIHAEPYSAAEALHGPIVIAETGFPVFAFLPEHPSAARSLRKTLAAFRDQGARTLTIGTAEDCNARTPPAPHWLLHPLIQVTAFYAFVEQLSRARGQDPDQPPGLKKVTETL